MQKMSEKEWSRLQDEVERIVTAEGMELWDIEFKPEQGGPVLRIFIDKPDKVTIDDCVEISNQVGIMLDVHDLVPGHYNLEVSSPGMDRKLIKPEHFERYIGRKVRIRLHDNAHGRKKFGGRLESFTDGLLTIQDEDEGQVHTIPYNEIDTARLEIEL